MTTGTRLAVIAMGVLVYVALRGLLAFAETQYSPLTFYKERPSCADAQQVYLLRSPRHLGTGHLSTPVWVCGMGQ
jgi:hypothetical protein